MENCVIRQLKEDFTNSDLLKLDEFRIKVLSLRLRCSEVVDVKILTPGVTFSGTSSTETTVGTTAVTLTLSAVGVLSISKKSKIVAVDNINGGVLDFNDFAYLSELSLLAIQQNMLITGNVENMQTCKSLSELVIPSNNTNTYSYDGNIDDLPYNEETPLGVTLTPAIYVEFGGDITSINHKKISFIEITKSKLYGDFGNFIPILSASVSSAHLNINLAGNTALYGTLEDFVANQRTAGNTSWSGKMVLYGTQITYNDELFEDALYTVTWTASTLTVTRN